MLMYILLSLQKNKNIHDMDYRTDINNFSYGVTMNGRNDIKNN